MPNAEFNEQEGNVHICKLLTNIYKNIIFTWSGNRRCYKKQIVQALKIFMKHHVLIGTTNFSQNEKMR